MSVNLEDLLAAQYKSPEWALVYELSDGVGSSRTGYGGAIDVAAFNCWPSKGWHRIAFEIKRTRQDFKREIDRPKKREWVEKNFHQTYIVVPYGLVKVDEVPESWGLFVTTKEGDSLRRVKVAAHREIGPMPETFALSAIRALADTIAKDRSRHFRFEGEDIAQEALDAKVEEEVRRLKLSYERAIQEVKKVKMDLSDAKSRVEAPLEVLSRAAHDYGWFNGGEEESKKLMITSEVVLGWIDRIRHDAVRHVMREVFMTHETLGRLIEAAKEAGLDCGEPREQEKKFRRQGNLWG